MKQAFNYSTIQDHMADLYPKQQPTGATHDLDIKHADEPQEPSVIEVSAPAAKILAQYSKIPTQDQLTHLIQVRDLSLSVDPKSYLAHAHYFPDFALWQSPAYPEILDRLKNGEQFIDVGCGIGQELRQLASDGIPTENLYGLDSSASNFTTGYTLFKDHSTLNGLFLPTSILDTASGSIQSQLTHKMDILWTSNLLHLMPLDHQITATTNMLNLMRRNPDALIAGRTRGAQVSGLNLSDEGTLGWWHDVASFKKMFHDAADRVGEKWETEVEIRRWSKQNAMVDDLSIDGGMEIWFVAKKLARIDIGTSHNFVF